MEGVILDGVGDRICDGASARRGVVASELSAV